YSSFYYINTSERGELSTLLLRAGERSQSCRPAVLPPPPSRGMEPYAGMLKVNDSPPLLFSFFSNASGNCTTITFQCSSLAPAFARTPAYVPSVHRGASWLVFSAGFCTSLHAKGDVARRSCGAFYSISILWCGFTVWRLESVGIMQFTASNHLFILLKKAAPSPRSRPRSSSRFPSPAATSESPRRALWGSSKHYLLRISSLARWK